MKYLEPSFNVGGASASFDEGYERTFGKKRERNQGKRFVYTTDTSGNVQCSEIGEDWQNTEVSGGHKSEEEVYGHLQATDGADISTRRRHREYMAHHGLTMTEDYKGSWARAKEQRENFFQGKDANQSKRIRESLERNFHEMRKRGRFK